MQHLPHIPTFANTAKQTYRAQLAAATSPIAFAVARHLVRGKAANQIAYLKHLQLQTDKDLSKEITQAETLLTSLSLIVDNPQGRDQLFGIEGYIADRYFAALKKLYLFSGRKPQGRDKFNSTLNYGYGILYNEVERACPYVGLDPYLGLYHSERYGKPSLVFDLVEEFRAPLIDSTIFPLFLEKMIAKAENFSRPSPGVYRLSPEGKRKVVLAVYARLNQIVHWDGKQRSVKTVIQHQVRSLAHVFLGKQDAYHPFTYHAVKEAS